MWYYEYNREADKNVKNKLLNKYKVVRFEAKIDDDCKIIQELEQNFYDYKKKYFKTFLFNIII